MKTYTCIVDHGMFDLSTGGRTSKYVRRGLSFGNILPNNPLSNMTGERFLRKINNNFLVSS